MLLFKEMKFKLKRRNLMRDLNAEEADGHYERVCSRYRILEERKIFVPKCFVLNVENRTIMISEEKRS